MPRGFDVRALEGDEGERWWRGNGNGRGSESAKRDSQPEPERSFDVAK